MKQIIHFLFSVLLFISLAPQISFGQKAAMDESLYAAYFSSSKTLYEKAVQKISAHYKSNPTNENLLNLAIAENALLSYTLKDKDEVLFDKYIDDAVKHLKTLIADKPEWGEPKALLSSAYGFKIAYSPMKGMLLGGKSSSLIEKAAKQSPESALVWRLHGSNKLFTPEQWGGDKSIALESFQKSIALFENQEDDLSINWLYLDTLAWTGQACSANEKNKEAISVYTKALEIEPDFHWVGKSLLPNAKKKI